MQIGELMRREVRTTTGSATVAEVARMLRDGGISSVVVLDDGRLSGIITERDVVTVVAAGKDPATTPVREGMTTDLDTVEPRTDVLDAAARMARRRIRHLPVVQDGTVVGMVSIRDLSGWAVDELTGGHELPDLERSHGALAAAAEIDRT
jgi:CBS domain-containing protein